MTKPQKEPARSMNDFRWGDTMHADLRASVIESTDPDRLTDAMREGQDDNGLFLAWLRS